MISGKIGRNVECSRKLSGSRRSTQIEYTLIHTKQICGDQRVFLITKDLPENAFELCSPPLRSPQNSQRSSYVILKKAGLKE